MITPATKEALYVLLDLLDSLSRMENNVFTIKRNSITSIKHEIISLMNSDLNFSNKNYIETPKKKLELIGSLPSILIDEKKFPKNDDIVKLMKKSLNMNINRWKKISRKEIIGHVITELAKREENELEMFTKAWKEFTQDRVSRNHINLNNKTFVDVWLQFYNNYKHSK